MTVKPLLYAGAAAIALAAAAAPAHAQREHLINIIHTNDVHSRVDQVTSSGGACSARQAAENQCFGGYPRLVTKIRDLRRNHPNPLVVDAGDYFQGSLFYTQYKSDAVKPFIQMIGYHAIALGNHEFDDGPAELQKFLTGLGTPVVAANIDVSGEPRLQGLFTASTVVDVGGQRVGVIGLTTSDTALTSSPGPTVRFADHAETLRREVRALERQGVNKIVALTHVGAAEDRRLAAMVDGVDVYVGGHSHSLFHNGDDRRRAAEYPVVVRTPSGAPALVVQAHTAGIFVGRLQVTFDARGVATAWEGNTELVDHTVAQDPEAQAMVERMAGPLAELRAREVAPAAVALDGDRASCRQRECNLGNLIADAMLWYTREAGSRIAIQNGGGIRTSIPQGMVTFGQILEVLPFSNSVSTMELTGAEVVQALENGVSQAESMENPGTGRFPQVAGIRFTWDAAKPAGERIVSVDVRNADGSFAPIDRAATYMVVTNNFMRNGGDGYAVFSEGRNPYDSWANIEDALAEYMRHLGSANPQVEGRITRVN